MAWPASVLEPGVDIRTMDRVVAACCPASPSAHQSGVIHFANDDLPRAQLNLGMAFQAEVIVALDEQLGVDRAVGMMASQAAFTQRFVFVDKGPGLFPVALPARLVQPGHGQPSGRLEDVPPVRIVALDAVHVLLDDRMMMGQLELGVRIQVALKARGGIFTRIHDELAAAAAGRHVPAARAVARFAAGHTRPFRIVFIKPAVRAARKTSGNVRVAIYAGGVPNKGGAFDVRRCGDGAIEGRAGTENQTNQAEGSRHDESNAGPALHARSAFGILPPD